MLTCNFVILQYLKLKEFQSHKKPDGDQTNVPDINQANEEEKIIENSVAGEFGNQSATASFFDSIPNDTSSFIQNVPTLTPLEVQQNSPTVQQNSFNNFQTPESYSNAVQSVMDHFSMPPTQEALANFPNPSNYFQPQVPTFNQLQSQPNDDKIKELHEQINQQSLQIAQLKSEVEFHRTTATNLQRNSEELGRMKQYEQQHGDTIKILVTEKSHLNDALQKSENVVATLKGENEELHNRLNVSRHRVKQLESISSNVQSSSPKTADIDPRKIEELVNERLKIIQLSLEAAENEKTELKLLLSQKKIEMENLQKNYDHLNTELHMQSIKIAQLSDGIQPEQPTNLTQIASFTQEVAIKQQQINELNSILDQLNREKEASETQYQNYVSAMTREMDLLKENSIELSNENTALVKREQELLKHVSDLERQMQQQLHKQKTYAENNQSEKEPASHAVHDEEIQVI